jgi:hypothetical protein
MCTTEKTKNAMGFTKTQDFLYEVPCATPHNTLTLTCWIEIWEHPLSRPVVLVTQMPDVAANVTDYAGEIIQALRRSLEWQGKNILYYTYDPVQKHLQRATFQCVNQREITHWQTYDPRLFYPITGHSLTVCDGIV